MTWTMVSGDADKRGVDSIAKPRGSYAREQPPGRPHGVANIDGDISFFYFCMLSVSYDSTLHNEDPTILPGGSYAECSPLLDPTTKDR